MLHSFEEEGHEIGLHIHWGSCQVTSKIKENFKKGVEFCKSRRESLRSFTQKEIKGELEYYLELMHELGFSPRSFRGGGLCQTTDCLKVLAEHGFEVDSSVASGLDEDRWHQDHKHVPYERGYYYPSTTGYDVPAGAGEDRMGILEIPVTRAGTDHGAWSSVLTVRSFPKVYEWAILHQKISPKVATLICHNWEIGRDSFSLLTQSLRNLRLHFSFISAFEHILTILKREGVKFVTMKELQEELHVCSQT